MTFPASAWYIDGLMDEVKSSTWDIVFAMAIRTRRRQGVALGEFLAMQTFECRYRLRRRGIARN